MTKKHFEAIAEIIKSHADAQANSMYPDAHDRFNAIEAVADSLAEYFASENPRFDEIRFLKACGVTD